MAGVDLDMNANFIVPIAAGGGPSIQVAPATRRRAGFPVPLCKTLVAAASILLLGSRASAFMILELPAPQDDPGVWRNLLGNNASDSSDRRAVAKSLEDEYQGLIRARIWPLSGADAAKCFGPVLSTATNWWDNAATNGGPQLHQHPNDLVLPVFVNRMMGLSGLHSLDPAVNRNHTDLHAIGDLGYVEIYYGNDGAHVEAAVLYHRADKEFVPLKSAADFEPRLKWDKARFALIRQWLDRHLAKAKPEAQPVQERAKGPDDSK